MKGIDSIATHPANSLKESSAIMLREPFLFNSIKRKPCCHLVYESFGQNSHFSNKSNNDGHFNIYSEIEICGEETQIIEAIEFVRNTGDITRYKMPWIIGNPYYVINETKRELAIQELENLKHSIYGLICKSAAYDIIGTGVYLFNFPPDLDDNEMTTIDKIFKYLAEPTSIFMTNPKAKLQSSPNILTTQEIQSLSRSYNLSFDFNDITHIDFKTVDKPESANFCAVFDCGTTGFFNYTPNYANRNYFVRFGNDNEILDTTKTPHEFTRLFIKSRQDCSASKTNALLKYLTKTFRVCQLENFRSTLTLYGFNLDMVPESVFSDLLVMMRHGNIIFEKICIRLSILITILEQSVGNRITFRRCRIIQDKIEEFTRYSRICFLSFCDMDIKLDIIRILKNMNDLQFINCHVLHNNREDVLNVWRFIDVTHEAQNVHFVCCDFPRLNIVEQKYSSVRNDLCSKSMDIILQTGFQLEKCKIQNRIFYENCNFRFESDSILLFDLKPVEIMFRNSTFESLGLYTILRKLHRESKVWLEHSYIMPRVEHFDDTASNKMILVKELTVMNCTIDTATLLKCLGKISSKVDIFVQDCKLLLPPDFICPNISIYTKNLIFYYVKFTQRNLITILNCLNQNSIVKFRQCVIIDSDCELTNFNQEHEIIIQFSYMTIDLNLPVFRQKNWRVYLDGCDFTNTYISRPKKVKPPVTIRDMLYYEKPDLELFEKSTKTSETTLFSGIIKPRLIEFKNVILEFKLLQLITKRIVADTIVVFNDCDFIYECSKRPIRVRSTYFVNMQIDVKTILWVLKNFTKNVEFKSCTISESHPYPISILRRLHLKKLILKNMDLTVNLFTTSVRICAGKVFLVIEKCNFIPSPQSLILQLPLCIRHLLFIDVDYSPGFLQSLQNLNGNCYVELKGRLSTKSVIEICTKTPIRGYRLRISSPFYTETFRSELITTYVESLLPSFNLCFDEIYDLPRHFFPIIVDGNELQHNWEDFQIRVRSVNDVTVKVDFLRGGEPIDLFNLLNDLPDDTERPYDYCTD